MGGAGRAAAGDAGAGRPRPARVARGSDPRHLSGRTLGARADGLQRAGGQPQRPGAACLHLQRPRPLLDLPSPASSPASRASRRRRQASRRCCAASAPPLRCGWPVNRAQPAMSVIPLLPANWPVAALRRRDGRCRGGAVHRRADGDMRDRPGWRKPGCRSMRCSSSIASSPRPEGGDANGGRISHFLGDGLMATSAWNANRARPASSAVRSDRHRPRHRVPERAAGGGNRRKKSASVSAATAARPSSAISATARCGPSPRWAMRPMSRRGWRRCARSFAPRR